MEAIGAEEAIKAEGDDVDSQWEKSKCKGASLRKPQDHSLRFKLATSPTPNVNIPLAFQVFFVFFLALKWRGDINSRRP